jgi:hypothetical protein
MAHLAQDVMEFSSERVAKAIERMGDVLGALLGVDKAPDPVKQLLERVGSVVGNLAQALGALLAGGDAPGPDGGLLERVGTVAATIARGLGDALGALLGGGDAPYPVADLAAQPLAALHGWAERSSEALERAGAAASNVARTTGGSLGADGAPRQTNKPVPAPVAPLPVAPIPVAPVAPGGPAGSASSFLSASGSPADHLQLPLAVLAAFSIALLQGGKYVYHRREPLRPHSALRLAIEHPG